MNCPKCAKGMKPGRLCGRGDNYFLPEGETVPRLVSRRILHEKHAVSLPPESLGIPFCEDWPAAFWCGDCKVLVADYAGLMQQDPS